MSKKERHHWVSKSYLKYWTKSETSDGTFWVVFPSQDSPRQVTPKSIGAEDRLYDLKEINLATEIGEWYLEKGLLARILEPALLRIIPNFKGNHIVASNNEIESAIFLAIQFWGRNPIAIEFLLRHFKDKHPEQLKLPFFKTKGNIALMSMFRGASMLKNGVGVRLHTRISTEKFITSDNPCSCWIIKDKEYVPVKRDTKLDNDGKGMFWIFPISPDCVIEFWFRGDGEWEFLREMSDDQSTLMLNNFIRKSSHRFVIEGYWYDIN